MQFASPHAGNDQTSSITSLKSSTEQGLPTVSISKLDSSSDATIEVHSIDDGDKKATREHSKQGLQPLPAPNSSACHIVLGLLHDCGRVNTQSSEPDSHPAACARPMWQNLARCFLVALCLAGVSLIAHWATKSDESPAADYRIVMTDLWACTATKPQSAADLYRNRTVCNQAAAGTMQMAMPSFPATKAWRARP
jgi:hypothetical protein